MEYIHKKTGNIYHFVKNTLIKIDSKWIDGVIYRNNEGMYFVRLKDDFNKSFIKSIDTNNHCSHDFVNVSYNGKLKIIVCQSCNEHII